MGDKWRTLNRLLETQNKQDLTDLDCFFKKRLFHPRLLDMRSSSVLRAWLAVYQLRYLTRARGIIVDYF